ncbi:transposase family protein [Kitasatospora sp. NPDC050543]|uniref:transposase family protein n=1 Tax=Kitasatospora sp. NPDC050543 TaxID=3364054 RepID=UPI003799C703
MIIMQSAGRAAWRHTRAQAAPTAVYGTRKRRRREPRGQHSSGRWRRCGGCSRTRCRSGRRHALAAVLALSACAVLTGATSLLAVGEWIAGAPTCVLERLGIRRDPLLPGRLVPAESTVRRLLARVDGDALDRAVGRWLADRRTKAAGATGLRGVSVDGSAPPPRQPAARSTCSPPSRPAPPASRTWSSADLPRRSGTRSAVAGGRAAGRSDRPNR